MPAECKYYDNGEIKSIHIIDEKGNAVMTEFDSLGRETRYVGSDGMERCTVYTGDGSRNLTWCIYPDGEQTITFNSAGAIKTIAI